MLLAPKEEAMDLRWDKIRDDGKGRHPCWGALAWCAERGLIPKRAKPDSPITALPEGPFGPAEGFSRREIYTAYQES